MCDTCGCNVTPANEHLVESVDVLKSLLDANDRQAAHNREHFARHGALAINLMSSPGAGKTALLEATIDALGETLKIAVIEGDLETENDAQRIRDKGVPAVQISTGSACHLDAHMVHSALHDLAVDGVDVVFIENVGNLVCPASFDLGQHLNVALLSTPEGHDKPAKYPVMFRAADLVVISKADLLDVLDDFDPDYAEGCLRQLASSAPVARVSARNGDGMDAWLDWLRERLDTLRGEDVAAGAV
ncbi:MAG: hydrogenase nickel incorporation protein HypB [Proteobacteria bacterium]|nr:hydrogenase nickel incorporation protein HypB [Pseudomonadota bacterium]